MGSLSRVFRKTWLIVSCCVFPLFGLIAIGQISLVYSQAWSIWRAAIELVLPGVLITTCICCVRRLYIQTISPQRHPRLKFIAQMLGAYLGGLFGIAYLQFISPNTLLEFNEVIDPVFQAKCMQDSHHCMGTGVLTFGFYASAILLSIPGAMVGAKIGSEVLKLWFLRLGK